MTAMWKFMVLPVVFVLQALITCPGCKQEDGPPPLADRPGAHCDAYSLKGKHIQTAWCVADGWAWYCDRAYHDEWVCDRKNPVQPEAK